MADPRPSYLIALSPSYHYADLNASLEAQVLDTRKNLMEALKNPKSLDEECVVDFNDVGEESLKVFLRIRPLTTQERIAGEEKQCFVVKDQSTICATAPPESWSFRNAQHLGVEKSTECGFSRVFDAQVKQDRVFDATTLNLAKEFVMGHNVLMFSYGVTNAGKTYTIQGSETEPGIIPRTLLFLFTLAREDLYPDLCFLPKFVNDAVVASELDKQALLQKKKTLLRLADAEECETDAYNAGFQSCQFEMFFGYIKYRKSSPFWNYACVFLMENGCV